MLKAINTLLTLLRSQYLYKACLLSYFLMRFMGKLMIFCFLMTGIILLGVVSCKHEIPSANIDNTVIVTTNCSPDTVYFQNQIQPLINAGCAMSGCHNAVSKAGGIELTSFSKIINYVLPGNATSSTLYKVLIKSGSDRMPQPPLPAFSTAQISAIQKWINQGAKNNACLSSCDSSKFNYSGAVLPLMQTYCIGCHSAASPGGGIDLSSYTQIKTGALNGKLYGSVNHSTGYSPMPKGGNKLSDCQIRQIKKWVDAGAQNN